MAWILEEPPKGIEGEPARARIFLILAAISWGLNYLLWESGLPILKLFGAFALLGAWAFSARAVFHVVTVGVTRLPCEIQGIAQILIALTGAVVPFIYLYPQEVDLSVQILVQAFEPYTKSILIWLPMSLFVYIVYAAASYFPSILGVRRYLILTGAVFLIVFIGGHGGFDTDEDGYSSSVERLDPKSIEGQVGMATSYLRLITLGYGTLLLSDLRQRVLSRRLEIAVRK